MARKKRRGNLLSTLASALRRERAAPSRTLGVGGTVVHGGYLYSNEKNRRLAGTEKYKTYDDILANVSIVSAGTRYFLNLLAKAQWKVEPAEDTGAKGEEVASLFEDVLHDMSTPWHRIVRRAAMYRFYGFSIQEWTAKKRDDGRIGFLDVESRPQRTIVQWDIDESGTVHGVVQESPQDFRAIYLPRPKLVYAIDDALTDSPDGLGLFRHVVEAAETLKRYQQLEGFGFETDLRGIPYGRAPLAELEDMVQNSEISDAERTAALAPIRDFLENHIRTPKLALLLDSMVYESQDEAGQPSNKDKFSVELLRGDPGSQEPMAAAIERLVREIARVLGVETLLLGETSRGSHALSKDKNKSFALIVDSTLLELRELMECDLLEPWMNLNGFDTALMPTLKPDSVSFREVEEITTALADMAQAGATLDPEDPAINEVRDLLGLSRYVPVANPIDVSLLGDTDDETPPGTPQGQTEDVDDPEASEEVEEEEDA